MEGPGADRAQSHLEWGNPRLVGRTIALSYGPGDVLGQQYFYESVHDFDGVIRALYLSHLLIEAGAPREAIYTVGVGFNTFDSIFYVPDGRLTMPSDGEPWRGRHSVGVAGWVDDGETLLFQNSWGARWGDSGDGYMSREYFDAHVDCVIVSCFAHVGLSAENRETPPDPTNPAWLEGWLQPRRRISGPVDVRGERHEIVSYRMISLDWDCPVDVIEIWTARRRQAWAHLFHPPGDEDRRSVIRELFVAPSVRRLGLGSALDDECAARAGNEGSRHLELEVDEADGSEDALAHARAFASARGYAWEVPVEQVRPILVATATKEI